MKFVLTNFLTGIALSNFLIYSRLQILKPGDEFKFDDKDYHDVSVDLKGGNAAVLTKDSKLQEAKYSVMYDQGMIIETDKERYITNFKYVIRPEYIDKLGELDTASYEAFSSICSETMVGFVQHLE